MKILRYCGREKLPGGERLWRRMARIARYDGTLEVYGWGVRGIPGQEQRASAKTGRAATVADFSPGVIRVWLPCECGVVDFYDNEDRATEYVLKSYAHELGHHRQHLRGQDYLGGGAEASAERYARFLLRRAS